MGIDPRQVFVSNAVFIENPTESKPISKCLERNQW